VAAAGQPGGPIRWSRWRGRLSAAAIVVVADVEAQILDEPVEQRGKVQRIPRRPRVVIAGQEPTGRGFIRGNQHANTLYLQRWLLSSGIVCRARFPPSTLPRPWRITSRQPPWIVPGLPNRPCFAEPARS
jgi:hypothetical protein